MARHFQAKAIRLVSSLRMGAVTLREERQSITIDSPEIVAELCSEMRFLDRELLRVVLLNAKQHLIKVVTVSQGTVNESLAHPREIFRSLNLSRLLAIHAACLRVNFLKGNI
jgi:DNA repair protein RadC